MIGFVLIVVGERILVGIGCEIVEYSAKTKHCKIHESFLFPNDILHHIMQLDKSKYVCRL